MTGHHGRLRDDMRQSYPIYPVRSRNAQCNTEESPQTFRDFGWTTAFLMSYVFVNILILPHNFFVVEPGFWEEWSDYGLVNNFFITWAKISKICKTKTSF